MNCDRARELLEPMLDGELDPTLQAEVREHVGGCVDCRTVQRDLQELNSGIRNATYYRAPAGLEGRIRKALHPAVPDWRWMAIAAILLLTLSLAGNFAMLRSRQSPEQRLAAAVVENHVRSLIGTHLLDVPSTDQHTVKPWFNGKLDYAPDVRDFAAHGFTLAGGRVEYIDGRRVAALVYQRRQHTINVFVWPSAADYAAVTAVKNGYNVIHWTKGGATWWIVSDLNAEELAQLARLLE